MILEILSYYWLPILFVMIGSYLIGGINASILVTKIFNPGHDIRDVGSGNAGFTNVLRTQGIKMGMITFGIDFLKGIVAIWFSEIIFSIFHVNLIGNDFPIETFLKYLTCLMCVIGHMFPCFFDFKGGKSILVTWSSMLLIDWRIFLILISVFLITLIFTKIVSLSSIFAAVIFPIAAFICNYFVDYKRTGNILVVWIPLLFCIAISSVVIVKHRGNILRIIKGEEKKFCINRTFKGESK